MAEERGLLVDVKGFNNAMDEARERSRNAQNKVLRVHITCSSYTSEYYISKNYILNTKA
jgi:alanyl-tRNA synthetase